jgi:hypothetical protein
MTEEVKDLPDQQEQEKKEEATPQFTETELKALDMGWKPKEQFHGSEDDFIDAKEFVRRQPLFDKIESTNRQVKQLNAALSALQEHYSKVNESAYNRAIADLKAQRKDALSNGDGDRFEAIDDQIKEAEKQKLELETIKTPTVPEEEHPEFKSWKARNTWYGTTSHMRVFADEVGVRLHKQGKSPSEVLAEVEKAVRAEFPNKFRNQNKDHAVQLENGRQSQPKGEAFELTDTERRVMNTLVRSNVMTKEQYIADLKKAKGT